MKTPSFCSRTRRRAAALACLLALLPAPALRAQSLAGRVNRAIDRGCAWLIAHQNEDGSFDGADAVHPSGRTALSLLALLHGGVASDHPAVKKGLDFLGMKPGYADAPRHRSTYETSLMVLLAHALGGQHEKTAHRLAQWLVDHFDKAQGLWGYPDGTRDLSNTQFAVYALKAASDTGFRAPQKLWLRLVERVIDLQDEEGGIRYRDDTLFTGSMTHAGLLVLHFAEEALGRAAPRARIRVALRRAQEWYEKNYTVERNPMGHGWAPGHYYYYMWGLERYGVHFGIQEIAGHDWYREGAEHLLSIQAPEGSWGSFYETAFAILFLRRAGLTVSPREPGESAPEGPAAAREEAPPPPPRPQPDVPFVREWLVAGPFACERGKDEMLITSHLDERRLAPFPGQPAGKDQWVHVISPEDNLDFAKSTRGADFAAWYAFTWVHAEEDTDVVLWLASDDGSRVYVDGEPSLEAHHHDGVGEDHYRLPLHLQKGWHRLLFKVENVGYYVWLKVRLTTPEGAALPDTVELCLRRRAR